MNTPYITVMTRLTSDGVGRFRHRYYAVCEVMTETEEEAQDVADALRVALGTEPAVVVAGEGRTDEA